MTNLYCFLSPSIISTDHVRIWYTLYLLCHLLFRSFSKFLVKCYKHLIIPTNPVAVQTYNKHGVVDSTFGWGSSQHETLGEFIKKGTFQDTERKGSTQSGGGVCVAVGSGMVDGENITLYSGYKTRVFQEEMPESRRLLRDLVFSFHFRLEQWKDCFMLVLHKRYTFNLWKRDPLLNILNVISSCLSL